MKSIAYHEAKGMKLNKLRTSDLLALYRKVVEIESTRKTIFAQYDTHKDIQLIENEFIRRQNVVENLTNKNVYIAQFKGAYLGGDAVIVTSGGERKAKNMLMKEIDYIGKNKHDDISLTKLDLTKEQLIVQDDGDY